MARTYITLDHAITSLQGPRNNLTLLPVEQGLDILSIYGKFPRRSENKTGEVTRLNLSPKTPNTTLNIPGKDLFNAETKVIASA